MPMGLDPHRHFYMEKIRLSEAIQLFYLWGKNNYSNRTLELYHGMIDDFISSVEDIPISEVQVMQHIIPYANKMRRAGKADTTINMHMIALRQFWYFVENVLQFEKKIKIQFKKDAIPVKSGAKSISHTPLTEEEWQNIQECFHRKNFIDMRDELILRILYATGMRVSELTALDIGSVNEDNRELIVITRKRRDHIDHRMIPYTSDVQEILQFYLMIRRSKAGGQALFISDKHNTRLTVRSIQRMFAVYCKNANIQGRRTPHSIRHSFGMRCAATQMYHPYLQQLMGHKNPNSSQIYYNIKNDSIKKEYHEKIGDYANCNQAHPYPGVKVLDNKFYM